MAKTKKPPINSRSPNKIYERFKVGRPARFKTAAELWEEALAYFAWCDNNPVTLSSKKRQRRNNSGDELAQELEPVSRPYTLYGLCLWLNMQMPWATFKQHCKRREDAEEFGIVLNACEQTIESQQVEGAMIGLYSERLTARLNGISEKTSLEVNQRQTTMSWEEYRKLMLETGMDD